MNITVPRVLALVLSFALAVVLFWRAPWSASEGDRALAVSLANDTTEEAAIASIVASGRGKVPLLLSWTKKPPPHVLECALDTGLADVFGRLRTKEAIPFLVKIISMYRSCGISLAPWLKVPALSSGTSPRWERWSRLARRPQGHSFAPTSIQWDRKIASVRSSWSPGLKGFRKRKSSWSQRWVARVKKNTGRRRG
jgi:hypothetical protein